MPYIMVVVISYGNARNFSGVLSNVPSFLFNRFKHMQRLIFVYVVRIRTCVSSYTHMRILVYFRFPVIRFRGGLQVSGQS